MNGIGLNLGLGIGLSLRLGTELSLGLETGLSLRLEIGLDLRQSRLCLCQVNFAMGKIRRQAVKQLEKLSSFESIRNCS